MLHSGYYEISAIAEALCVPTVFVMNEVEQEHLRFTLTLYGEPQFFSNDIQRWMVARVLAIREAKLELARWLAETVEH